MSDAPKSNGPEPNDRDEALLVHAYVDGELDPASTMAIERRIAADPALAAERERVETLRRVLREQLPREAAPPGLQLRVRRAIGVDREHTRPTWLAMAASIALAVMVSSSGTWLAMRSPAQDGFGDAVLAGHLRALMAPQPIDVASSDRHTVKPWFNGKLQQSPRVVDLASDGFPLVGGRIDVIGHTPVPTLVYRRREHVISLTAEPTAASQAAAVPRSVQGYNVIGWTANGVNYRAVSDLNTGELETFARLFRDAPE
jgi:anti-sigma factor RsiW